MSETIWVMESDLCEMCDGLLDWMGQCPHCGWDGYHGYPWDDMGYEEEYGPSDESGDYDEQAYLMGEYDDDASG